MGRPGVPSSIEDGWKLLTICIDKLQNVIEEGIENTTGFSATEASQNYSLCFNMCTTHAPMQAQLYDRYKQTLTKYCTGVVLPDIRRQRGEQLLGCLYRRWEKYKRFTKVLNFVFSYLDRFFTQRDRYTVNRTGADNPLPLLDLTHQIFKIHVFDGIKNDVNGIILQFILREREGEHVDRAMLKSAVEVFIVMGQGKMVLYETDFETAFLKDTTDYYRRLSHSWIQRDSAPEYLTKAEDRIASEMHRTEDYLHPSTGPKLNKVLNQELLAAHVKTLIEMPQSGALALLHDNKADDLARMYRMFARLEEKDGLLPMCNYLKDHIMQIGMDHVAGQGKVGADDVTAFVDRLLEIQAKYLDLVQNAFQNNQHFQKAHNEAFVEFVNKQTEKNTTAQLLAVYVNEYLKEKANSQSDEVTEKRFTELLRILHHVIDRDLFQEFYRKQLAKRLLMSGGNLQEEAEKMFIAKLKGQYGAAFTNRLEGMFTDHTLAAELQSQFAEHVGELPNPPEIDLEVQVLRQGYWPQYKTDDLILPPNMTSAMAAFKEFFCARKKNRILTWVHTLGTCVVQARFSTRATPVEVHLTTYQAVVLLLFNAGAELTKPAVVAATKLPAAEVERILASLAMHKNEKFHLLTKTGDADSISDTDVFTYNKDLVCKTRNLKLPGIGRLSVEEQKQVAPHVMQDRKMVTEAVIVRVMKTRQKLTHQELLAEVMDQLKNFRPESKMIKQRIEDLITRLYLKRDEVQQNLYHYLA